jgi:hypothetical protein
MIYVIVACICVILLAIFAIAINPRICEFYTEQNSIPKVIYTFWHDSEEIPPIVSTCIASWKRNNPDYKVVLLTLTNYREYCDIDLSKINNNDSVTRSSDFIRLNVLGKTGGVWMDSTILCNAKLVFEPSFAFFGFRMYAFETDARFPVVESWMFGCVPRCEFVCAWRDEFMRLDDFKSVDAYIDDVTNKGILIEKIPIKNYLAIHVAAQKVLQTKQYLIKGMQLMDCEEGPLKYLKDMEWDSKAAIQVLCDSKHFPPLVKLRGSERNVVTQDPAIWQCIQESFPIT